jgi:beta-N-acetylhexosaminidase
MDDMVGIAEALPAMSAETAARLERALAGTADFSQEAAIDAQLALIAKRDTLLALAEARA